MTAFAPDVCCTDGCEAPLPGAPGVHYCEACVARQSRAHAAEREAFEDFHAFADAVARRGRRATRRRVKS